MRNTTKLKHLLQLYTVLFDMNDDGIFYLTITNKRNGETQQFEDKAYTVLIGKAFGFMKKGIKRINKEEIQ